MRISKKQGTDAQNMEKKVIRFVREALLVEYNDEITTKSNLFEIGAIDSFSFVELITFLENECHVKITDRDVLSGDLSSVESIITFLKKKGS